METIALRVARVFGKGVNMRWDNFPHNFAREIHPGRKLQIYGDGRQRMDLVHVQDVCRAIQKAFEAPLPSGHYAVNIESGNPISVRDVVAMFRQNAVRMGLSEPRVEHLKDQDEQWSDFGMDIRRAMAHLGWKPSIALEDAVRVLLRAYPTDVT
jgi:UDP-glucose 4-epimerase